MATDDDVTVSFEEARQQPIVNDNDEEIGKLEDDLEEKEDEIEKLQGQLKDAQEQGNLKIRVPKLLGGSDGNQGLLATFDGSDGATFTNVTVKRMRESENIEVSGYDSTTPQGISGWNSSRYIFDGSDSKVTVSLYTNIGSPNTRQFWKVHGFGDDDLGLSVVVVPQNGSTKGSATIDSGEREGLDGAIQITGSPEAISNDISNGIEIPASFGGTSGRIICEACNSDPVSDYYTSSAGFKGTDWGAAEFRANRLTASHQRVQDETYLYFGIWARHPEDADSDYGTDNFQRIGGGVVGGDAENLSSIPTTLEGEATFIGGAVGEYAIGELGREGQDGYRKAKAGSFTATANLFADFGDTDTVHGNITGFQENGSSLGWGTLRLVGDETTALDTPGNKAGFSGINVETGARAGDMTISGTEVTGTWGATLYGVTNAVDTDGDGPTGATCQKTGCAAELAGFVGWFNADGGIVGGGSDTDEDVAIVGAFGAAYRP